MELILSGFKEEGEKESEGQLQAKDKEGISKAERKTA